MAGQTIDYDALAKKFGGLDAPPTAPFAARPSTPEPIDYDGIAAKYGGVDATPEQIKISPPQTWSEKLGMKGPILGGSWNPVKAQIDVTEGAVSGLASTAFKGGDLIRRGLGMKRVIDTPEAKQLMAAPPTVAGQVGHYGEQAAEFAIPMGGVARAVAKAPVLARMAVEGAAAGGIAGMQSGGDPAITGTAAAIGAIVPGLPTAWGAAKTGVKAGRAAVNRALLSNTSWEQALVKGLRPGAKNLKFKFDIKPAMRDLRGAEARTGKTVADSETPIADLMENVKDAQKDVWSQYEAYSGPQGPRGISLDSVADAMVARIPASVKAFEPEEYARLIAEADKRRGVFTMQQVEKFLHENNAKLNTYRAKYPSMQHAAVEANPETAAMVAEGDATREVYYKALDDPSEGTVPRALKQRYGALSNILREAESRYLVAERQAVNSLSEQVGKWRGAGRAIRGAYRATVGGDLLGGGADIADALTSTEAARALKETNTTNELLRHAFREFKGAPFPAVTPRPFRPAGLLPPGRAEFNMPPIPDTSGTVPGPPARYPYTEPRYPPYVEGRLLPPATTRFAEPVPPPPEAPIAVPAKRLQGGYIDPKTGRQRVQYLSGPGQIPSMTAPQQPPPPLVTPGPAQPLRAIEYQPPSPTMPPPLSTPGPPPAQMPPAMAAPPQPAPPAASPAPPPLATPRPTTIQTPQGTYTILGEEGGRVGVSFKNNKGIVSEYGMSVAEVERLVAKQR